MLELALSIVSRGSWTLPSWRVEQALAERARHRLDWPVEPVLPPGSGDLRLRLGIRVQPDDMRNVLLPSPVDDEVDRADVVRRLCDLIDGSSPGERIFVESVAAWLPLPLLGLLVPQRDVASMGLDPDLFADQRVDFALETAQGLRLVIEIDGGQHTTDAAQVHLDRRRDEELKKAGWTTWRVPSRALDALEPLLRTSVQETNRCPERKVDQLPETARRLHPSAAAHSFT